MTAAADLAHVRTNWPHLADMLDTRHTAPWPPAGRMTDYLRTLETGELDGRANRDGSGSGEHPAPLRLEIVDTARVIEAALYRLADEAAQYEPADVPAAERWHPAAGRRHGIPWACVWLTGALEWLTPVQVHYIDNVAREAARRLDTALDQARRHRPVDHPCPHCRQAALTISGGDGTPPTVTCGNCRWVAGGERIAA